MKVLKRYAQHRRDLSVDLECEGCGATQAIPSAYDDRNYWDNVVPNLRCLGCGESTKSLGLQPEFMPTTYPEHQQV